MRATVFAVFMLAIAVSSTGCASLSAAKATPEPPKPARRATRESIAAGEVISDESIGFAIRRRLNEDPGEMAGVIVEVDDGNVLLRGSAPNLSAAWRAEAAARSVKGVKQVSNQILVPGRPLVW